MRNSLLQNEEDTKNSLPLSERVDHSYTTEKVLLWQIYSSELPTRFLRVDMFQ